MTIKSEPFLLRFADAIEHPERELVTRYDSSRQIVQVHEDGSWVDAPDASEPLGYTRETRVNPETTDDS